MESSRKTVLMVTPVAPWGAFGGTVTVSKNLVELFAEHVDLSLCCLRVDQSVPPERREIVVLSGGVSSAGRRLKLLFDFSAESFATRQFQKKKVVAGFTKLLEERRPRVVIFDHIYSAWLIEAVRDRNIVVAYIAHDDMVTYADSIIGMHPPILRKMRFAWLGGQYRKVQERILQRCDILLTLTSADAVSLTQRGFRGQTDLTPLYFDIPDHPVRSSESLNRLLITGSFDTWEKQAGLFSFLDTIFRPLSEKFSGIDLILAGRLPVELQRKLLGLPYVQVFNAPSAVEMRELLNGADIAAVLDIQASGLKIKTIELAAAGLPLVAWPPGIEGTMLGSERSCLVASSTPQFIAQLSRLICDSQLRHRLGNEARITMEREFNRKVANFKFRSTKLFEVLNSLGAIRSSPS